MVVPFGFSASDFVAFIQLVANIVSAIREAKVATVETQQLISSLQCLQKSLNSLASEVGIADVDSSSRAGLPLSERDSDLARGIGFEIHHCRRLLQNFCTENSIELPQRARFWYG